MKCKLMIFLIFLISIFSCCTIYGLEPAPYVKGVISLPDGKVAPAGGINLKVVLQSGSSSISREFVIKAGENSVAYR